MRTNSQHNNPLCRVVVPIEESIVQATEPLLEYHKEKYKEMILDAVETVLGPCGFDRTVHSSGNGNFNKRNKARRIKWYEELRGHPKNR